MYHTASISEERRKNIPRKICNKDESIRVPLFGRNICVLNVKIKVNRPEIRMIQPNSQALANNVSIGLHKQTTPSTMSATPATANQIFVLFFIIVNF